MSSSSNNKKPKAKSANSRPNPAVQSSKTALVHAAGSSPHDQAALKAAVSFAKQHLGKNFDKRSYFNTLSDSMKGYLATLVNPFELGKMKASFGVPIAPSVPSRKYSCFARGTFATCPRNVASSEWVALDPPVQQLMLQMTEENAGYIMVSPKLFGVNTTTTTYTRTQRLGSVVAAPTEGGGSLSAATTTKSVTYHLLQQPVVYTTPTTGFGCPNRLFEVNPVLQGERFPVVTNSSTPGIGNPVVSQYSAGIDLFSVPTSYTGLSPVTQDPNAMFSGVAYLTANLNRVGSNSDVNWWEVMPPDSYGSSSASILGPSVPFSGTTDESSVDAFLTDYSGADVLNSRKIRLVSCGIRIKYIGTEIARGGQVIGLREPSGLTMASGAYGGVIASGGNTISDVTSSGPPAYTVPQVSVGIAQVGNTVMSTFPCCYETSPGFRSADWRAFGAIPAGPFGCANNSNASGGGPNWVGPDMHLVDPGPPGAWVGSPFDPTSDDNYGFDQLSEYDQGVPGDVERPWDELVYYPIDPTSLKYEYLYETITVSRSGRMGATPPVVYYAEPSAVTKDKPTPKPGESSIRLGHFTYQGKVMSASDAAKAVAATLNAQRSDHAAAIAKHLALNPTSLAKHRLGEVASYAQMLNTATSGDVTVHLGVSRADNDWGYSMAWMVRAPDSTTVTKFQFEVVGHYEIIGRDVRGQTAGAAPDPVGMAAVSSLGHDLAYATTSESRVKHNVTAVASKVVQAVSKQSGVLDNNSQSFHDKIVDGANTVASIGKGAIAAGKTLKSVFDEVSEFLGPLAEGVMALF